MLFGTCNTPISFDDCTSNMDWFASQLNSACAKELSINNALVQSTLLGLQAYPVVRTAGCLIDQRANTYCYLDAVHASSPADLYLYQLPLATPMPQGVTPSCSACAGSVLGVYFAALQDNAAGNESARGLQSTYESAASNASSTCGTGYAQLLSSGSQPLVNRPSSFLPSMLFLVITALLSIA